MKPRRVPAGASPRSAVAVGDVLDDVLRRVDPEHQLHAYAIWTFWNDEVGSAIAQRAQPTHFRNGVLSVTVATHTWMQELQFMKDTIRERLNARLGATLVRDIFFVSGRIAADAALPASEVVATQTPSIAPVPAGSLALPPIADPELAAAFARVLAARARRGAHCTATQPRGGRRRASR
jgi:hypothetical protein